MRPRRWLLLSRTAMVASWASGRGHCRSQVLLLTTTTTMKGLGSRSGLVVYSSTGGGRPRSPHYHAPGLGI